MTTPNPEAPEGGKAQSISDERILHLWDTHVAYETNANRPKQPPLTDKDKLAFARAVLYASVEARGDSSNPPMQSPHAGDPVLSDDVCDAYGVPRGSRRSEVHDDYPAPARTYLHPTRVDALIAVMEGECDGLAVTRETAEAILHYIDGNAPPAGVDVPGGGRS